MSMRTTLWGMSNRPHATRNAILPRDLPPLPNGSILYPSRSPLERSDVSQSLRDVGIVLLISFTGLAFGVGLFVLAFIEV